MTEQSTPTPLEELVAMRLTSELFIASDGHRSVGMRTDEEAAAILIAAGWKSPAEVAEMVRAGAYQAFENGVTAGTNQVDDEWRRRRHVRLVVNPYSKPILETVPSDV